MNITLTLLGQAISFALFVFFCMKFVWPPVIGALRDRQKNISDGLQAAEQARLDLQQAEVKQGEMLQEGKAQASVIIANANKRAASIIEDAKTQAEEEKSRILVMANQEIKQNTEKARSELSSSLSVLISQGVNKIVGKEVDISAHKSIINDLDSRLK